MDSVQQNRLVEWFGDLHWFKSTLASDQYQTSLRKIVASGRFGTETDEVKMTQMEASDDPSQLPQEREFEVDELFRLALQMTSTENRLASSPNQKQEIENQLHGNRGDRLEEQRHQFQL